MITDKETIKELGAEAQIRKMTELKTLKDLTINLSKNLGTGKPDKDFQIAKILELKQEAIKWVKEDLDTLVPTGEHGEYQQLVKDILINRWMKRFNLTKEDLK